MCFVPTNFHQNFSLTVCIARMGWDDNGLPTERRVQNYFHCFCSRTAPYEPDLTLQPALTAKDREGPRRMISRKNFIELCSQVTKQDEEEFKLLFQRLGAVIAKNLSFHCYHSADDYLGGNC